MGINLTAACVVIMFDQDFNPHNDKQACDRAYRIGQKRDVEVVKLITRGTIEESMLRLGQVKLDLDHAVAAGEADEGAPEKTMKASLLSVLRKQFEEQGETQNAARDALLKAEASTLEANTGGVPLLGEDTVMANS
ncbi:hypothetical protein BS47DRAFT_227039 [Hydnum rufescens UP504]|uniref:Helicase C-terminal domain-containing protein n=1 Tax=Hydnum rufescens UP504 TaxID=1448309 RepID=A0A9P6E0Y5_9AGAM|nr:hypothetical protein BS47DRAFT_227039 [Hydnum rufescens UP504]